MPCTRIGVFAKAVRWWWQSGKAAELRELVFGYTLWVLSFLSSTVCVFVVGARLIFVRTVSRTSQCCCALCGYLCKCLACARMNVATIGGKYSCEYIHWIYLCYYTTGVRLGKPNGVSRVFPYICYGNCLCVRMCVSLSIHLYLGIMWLTLQPSASVASSQRSQRSKKISLIFYVYNHFPSPISIYSIQWSLPQEYLLIWLHTYQWLWFW